ncbi:BLUF domain-containing protein [Henriciella barbarensis]|uniref:BLUF domain-containing protein n=1 Tax=Henriciella barbarensis TaxID=86342 RepID=A0A399QUT1_9PROT|nr:BLUF domain-containing protein [Henriciella barbarensis]RIJ22211.1 BLUF domain-containing protein [Henriciella barbarensis]
MKRLIYLSKARPSLHGDALYDLLAAARDHNRRAAITGLLIQQDQFCLQVIEGDEAAVRGSFARIRRDWRHENCHVIFHDDVPGRLFPGWPLAYRAGRDLERGQVRQLADIVECATRLADKPADSDRWAMDVYLRALLDSFSALTVQ